MPPTTPPPFASCAHSATAAASLFLQLASPSRCAQRPVLDFLLPRAGIARELTARRTKGTSLARQTARRDAAAAARRASSRSWGPTAGAVATMTPRSVFASYTSTRRFTQAVFNLQKDDDGNDMKLDITPRAAKRLSEIMRKDANPNLALRIQVESGGCHGFQYLMSLVTLPDSLPSPSSPPAGDSSIIRQDDTIFTYAPDETSETTQQVSGIPKIILDQPSLELLKGSKVDFTMELIGSQFKIVDNPLATSSCGCGTSFDIKF